MKLKKALINLLRNAQEVLCEKAESASPADGSSGKSAGTDTWTEYRQKYRRQHGGSVTISTNTLLPATYTDVCISLPCSAAMQKN